MVGSVIAFLETLGFPPPFAETLFRLLLGAVCGGLIGLERELKGRPAGLKTFSLVCMGAALVMVTNEYIGTGFYFGGAAGLVVLYLSSFTYRRIDAAIVARSRIMRIYVEGESEEFMLRLVEFFRINQIRIVSLTRREENKWFLRDSAATIEMDLGRKRSHADLLDAIRTMEELRYVEEV